MNIYQIWSLNFETNGLESLGNVCEFWSEKFVGALFLPQIKPWGAAFPELQQETAMYSLHWCILGQKGSKHPQGESEAFWFFLSTTHTEVDAFDSVLSCGSRYLYLMTTNFSEKQRWVAALEAAVRSVQRQDRLSKSVRSLSPWVSVTMDWKSLSLWTILNDLGHYGSGDRKWGWVLCWHGVLLNTLDHGWSWDWSWG